MKVASRTIIVADIHNVKMQMRRKTHAETSPLFEVYNGDFMAAFLNFLSSVKLSMKRSTAPDRCNVTKITRYAVSSCQLFYCSMSKPDHTLSEKLSKYYTACIILWYSYLPSILPGSVYKRLFFSAFEELLYRERVHRWNSCRFSLRGNSSAQKVELLCNLHIFSDILMGYMFYIRKWIFWLIKVSFHRVIPDGNLSTESDISSVTNGMYFTYLENFILKRKKKILYS